MAAIEKHHRVIAAASTPHAGSTRSARLAVPESVLIYEHGQEDATITGTVVGATKTRRLRYFLRTNALTVVPLTLFIMLLAALISLEVAGIPSHHPDLAGWRDRFATGLVPVILINVIGLLLAIRKRPKTAIAWSQRYGEPQLVNE